MKRYLRIFCSVIFHQHVCISSSNTLSVSCMFKWFSCFLWFLQNFGVNYELILEFSLDSLWVLKIVIPSLSNKFHIIFHSLKWNLNIFDSVKFVIRYLLLLINSELVNEHFNNLEYWLIKKLRSSKESATLFLRWRLSYRNCQKRAHNLKKIF